MFPQAVFAPIGRVSGPLARSAKPASDDVFLFDLEVLTSNIQGHLEYPFADYLQEFMSERPCYMFSRTSFNGIINRLPQSVLRKFKAVFASCGTELWIDDKLTVCHDHAFSDDLYEFVVNVVRKSGYYDRTPPLIDQGAACLRICLAGIRCSANNLRIYERWERTHQELPEIINQFQVRFPDHTIYQDTQTSLLILPDSFSTATMRDYIRSQHKASRMTAYVHKGTAEGYANALCRASTSDVVSKIAGPSDISQLLSYELRRMKGMEQMIHTPKPEQVEA